MDTGGRDGLRELRRIGLSVNALIRLRRSLLHTLENLAQRARYTPTPSGIDQQPLPSASRFADLIAKAQLDHSAAEPILPAAP